MVISGSVPFLFLPGPRASQHGNSTNQQTAPPSSHQPQNHNRHNRRNTKVPGRPLPASESFSPCSEHEFSASLPTQKNPCNSREKPRYQSPSQKTLVTNAKNIIPQMFGICIYIWWFLVQIIQLSFSGVHFRCRYYAHYTSCWCFWKMFDSLIGISSAYKSKEILETAKHVNTYRFIRRCSGLSSSPIRNCHRALHIHPFYANQWILTLLTLLSNHD